MNAIDKIRERDKRIAELTAELAALKAGKEKEISELKDDIEELIFCEDCAESCTKLPDNNCYPPRYCHGCRHKLVEQICEMRARALSAEARVEAAERRSEKDCDAYFKMKAHAKESLHRATSAEADAARMRQVIEAVEWGGLRFIPGDDGMDRCCPSCDGFIERGHKPECILFAALAAPAPQEERSAKSCIHPSSYCEVCQANSTPPLAAIETDGKEYKVKRHGETVSIVTDQGEALGRFQRLGERQAEDVEKWADDMAERMSQYDD